MYKHRNLYKIHILGTSIPDTTLMFLQKQCNCLILLTPIPLKACVYMFKIPALDITSFLNSEKNRLLTCN